MTERRGRHVRRRRHRRWRRRHPRRNGGEPVGEVGLTGGTRVGRRGRGRARGFGAWRGGRRAAIGIGAGRGRLVGGGFEALLVVAYAEEEPRVQAVGVNLGVEHQLLLQVCAPRTVDVERLGAFVDQALHFGAMRFRTQAAFLVRGGYIGK